MDLLNHGQKISLNIIKQDMLIEIVGVIADVLDDRLIVELPPYFMRYVEYLDVGCNITAKVFSKMGTVDFNSIVISSPLEDGNLVMELDINAIKFTPSDELPRVGAIENISIKAGNNVINTQTFEIATEYIKFYSDVQLSIDDTIDCELKFPDDYGTIRFKANVTEQDIVYDNEYKASYFNMSEQDRETLLYYMYIYANNMPIVAENTENAKNAENVVNEDNTIENNQEAK